jgi:flagellar motility protein MotE (MotC chaperone)
MTSSAFATGMKPAGLALPVLAALMLLLAASAPLAAETIVEEPGAPHGPAAIKIVPAPLENGTEIERFCSNIADAARDRRYVLQTQELLALQQEVDKRIKTLEEKRVEYEAWLKRREQFLALAEDGVVKIYAGMRPDAAAERLTELDATLAAGILMKLDARKAGVILNEMEAKAAAMLTGIMANAARRTDPT